MNHSKLLMAVFLSTVALILSSSPSSACPMHHGGMGQGKSNLSTEDVFFKKMHLIFDNQDALKLSDEQLARIKKLKVDTKKTVIMRDAEIDVKKIDIKAALYEEAPDLGAVNTSIDQKYELKKQKDKAVTAALIELKKILSPQQKETLKSLFMEKGSPHYSKKMVK